jgi:hypothetical protein
MSVAPLGCFHATTNHISVEMPMFSGKQEMTKDFPRTPMKKND